MPQLDLTTYNLTSSLLLLAFWTYFAVLYIAVSYTSQKISSAFYFKFYTILVSILVVYALEVESSKESSISLGGSLGSVKNFAK